MSDNRALGIPPFPISGALVVLGVCLLFALNAVLSTYGDKPHHAVPAIGATHPIQNHGLMYVTGQDMLVLNALSLAAIGCIGLGILTFIGGKGLDLIRWTRKRVRLDEQH